ncbi:MAG: hypothetical protein ACREQQ_03305 [Candidatus Binatia bacterium]
MKPITSLLLFLIVLVAAPSFAGEDGVVRVESKYVCMVNDTLFPKEQIAVDVDGKRYFGCCEMCKERLAKNAGARMAVDPLSGHEVDKARAVIGAKPDGKVLYFESQESFDGYARKKGS